MPPLGSTESNIEIPMVYVAFNICGSSVSLSISICIWTSKLLSLVGSIANA
jgi:hypothetical protein